MKESQSRFSPAYRGTLVIVVSQQILLGLLCGMMLDNGLFGSLFLYSLVSFWIGFITILARRPYNPTKTDLFVIKWGTFLLFLVSILISPIIWKIRGAM